MKSVVARTCVSPAYHLATRHASISSRAAASKKKERERERESLQAVALLADRRQ
jgi:hypothetical protein